MQSDRKPHDAWQIYPAYCFPASLTLQKWVKLTAEDVHGLQSHPFFEGQNIYFHLNHPIRFVYLSGIIIHITRITDKFTLVTLDDSSGSTIDVKISHVLNGRRPVPPTLGTTVEENDGEPSIEEEYAFFGAEDNGNALTAKTFATETPGITVTDHPPGTDSDPTTLTLDGKHILTIGSLIKAKGKLTKFRDVFQLMPMHVSLVEDLDAEVALWEDYAKFCEKVLCRPWILSANELKTLEEKENKRLRELEEEERYEVARSARSRAKKRKFEVLRQRHEEKAEAKRLAQCKILDGNPLDSFLIQSDSIPTTGTGLKTATVTARPSAAWKPPLHIPRAPVLKQKLDHEIKREPLPVNSAKRIPQAPILQPKPRSPLPTGIRNAKPLKHIPRPPELKPNHKHIPCFSSQVDPQSSITTARHIPRPPILKEKSPAAQIRQGQAARGAQEYNPVPITHPRVVQLAERTGGHRPKAPRLASPWLSSMREAG